MSEPVGQAPNKKFDFSFLPQIVQASYPLMPYVVLCYAMYLAPPEIVKQAWIGLLLAGAALIDPKSRNPGGGSNS